ncbi:glycosyltransferase family 2 protein [Sphaerotilus sp.]|uniref:glycosyltransferase family 2 protein n=1 Tax=Sphaerotilus sp. TaxID=2093942 RepID=UPI002ACE9456|nr:glycosyltransferase family 2 protein [Sphaerotilus sp.]MDZ7855369.1 glycosyltransferase family 2 protein [Sphaerotilus sp.]
MWAAHKLGLHALVADAIWDGRHLHGGMAMAVSLATLGRTDDAHAVVDRLRHRNSNRRLRVELAQALAASLPEVALSLVDHPTAPWTLRCALLLRLGDRTQAVRQLQAARQAGQVDPQWHLLAANALDNTPVQLLDHLNHLLTLASLSPLGLRDTDRPPGTLNLQAAQTLRPVDGPRISVLMTTHQTQDRVGPAIESLLEQTWRNLEIVVVDDASTDGTVEQVRALAERDARVRCVQLQRNVGTYVAKTIGLAHATGEFITCQDSDDWAHPQKLAMQMQPLLRNRRLVATTSKWVRLSDDGHWHARAVYPLTRLNPASPLFRRREVECSTGLWDAVRTGADSEFLARLRLVFGAEAVQGVPLPLTFGAHRTNSLMTAADTGYSAAGLSPARQAYWEAWTHWHIATLRAGHTPRMPRLQPQQPHAIRPFAAPDLTARV